MTHSIHRVAEFHKAFGHPVANRVNDMTPAVRELRVRLIAEELTELCVAWGVNLNVTVKLQYDGEVYVAPEVAVTCRVDEEFRVDHVEGADALGDLDYVVQGSNLVAGYPAEYVLAEIHASNMSKLGADGKPVLRADGKILKGPGYYPPQERIKEALRVHPFGYTAPNPDAVLRDARRWRAVDAACGSWQDGSQARLAIWQDDACRVARVSVGEGLEVAKFTATDVAGAVDELLRKHPQP